MAPEPERAAHQTAQQLLRTQEIFYAVLNAPREQRSLVLSSHCQGDTALMEELRELLAACEAEEALSSQLADESNTAQPHPRDFGPYRLDSLLGRGGMGAVYLAHRVDGEFEQQVAIKIIDLPLATDSFRMRLRQERQILAGLVHPYIARLLDGGVTEDGEPYLAMEYVDGVAITRFCKQHALPPEGRLRLFVRVCEAVQFAHQNLVVHRDLKPDNILVVADGTPRLLDFGTAKLLAPVDVDPATEWTRQGLQAFTPQYASPEQVLGEPITTASDVYSLGVLLYLLVSGRAPYELQEFTTAEMLRVICQQPPPKPSTRPHAEAIDPDLDAITMKALRKDPSERYTTVDLLSRDVQALLDGRPVQAQRGSRRYVAAKFVRRNRGAFVAACLIAASMMAGVVGVLWQSRAANLQRMRAEARSADLRQLSNSLLSEIDDAVKELPGSTSVQHLLVERALEQLDRLSADAKNDRLTQLDLVEAYTRLGNLQGNPYDQNIGDDKGALLSLAKALALARELQTAEPKNAAVLGALALAEQSRSEILFGAGRTEEAVASMRLAANAYQARMAQPGATAVQIADASTAMGGLGDELGKTGSASLGDPVAALASYQEALALSQRALTVDPKFARSRRAIPILYAKIGGLQYVADPWQAIDMYNKSLAAWRTLAAEDPQSISIQRGMAYDHFALGLAYTEAMEYEPALAAAEESIRTDEALAAQDAKDTRAQYDLAVALANEGLIYMDMLDASLNPHPKDAASDKQHAIALLGRSVQILKDLLAGDPDSTKWVVDLASYQVTIGGLLQEQAKGIVLQASPMATLRLYASREDASVDTLDLASSALVGPLPAKLQDPALAVKLAERLVTLTHRRKVSFLLTLSQAYRAAGDAERSRSAALEALALLPAQAEAAPESRIRKLLAGQLQRDAVRTPA